MSNTNVSKFASVAEAVASLASQGFETVLHSAGPNKVRLMQNKSGDIKVIRHLGLLDVLVEDDDGYWYDKLQDWASDSYILEDY